MTGLFHARALRAVMFLSVAVAGCGGKGASLLVCEPTCPAGTRCTENGCVAADGIDLASSNPGPGDLGACDPPCIAPTPFCNGGHCEACLVDAQCPPGQTCRAAGGVHLCVPGCSDDSRCAGGGASLRCCGGACTDTSQDPANCGACGRACSALHADTSCAGGQCQAGGCLAGWGDCDAAPGNGCEVNLRVDADHCGACGRVCATPHSVMGCADGCYVAACEHGWDDCNPNAPGCETSVLEDPKSCGGCSVACAPKPHAQIGCVAGTCRLVGCTNGFGDCNSYSDDGCEINLLTDIAHCGTCDTTCAQGQVCKNGLCDCPPCGAPNATTVCANKQCAITQCAAGFADCDRKFANGCETLVNSDSGNCGFCGNACANGLVCKNGGCTCAKCDVANARTTCPNSVCVLDQCLNGFADCDKNPANGCEINLAGDNANCGSCNFACGGQLPFCLGGVCGNAGLSCSEILKSNPNAPSGAYAIDPDGQGGNPAFAVWCDMTTAGGGWTLVLNLDTSDGHVMWWGNPLWENVDAFGAAGFGGDHKSPAWSSLGQTSQILLVVHRQGTYKGWKQFNKVNARTMHDYFADNQDNTLIGDRVIASDTVNIDFGPERLVRTSSQLYANHCVQTNGKCTSGTTGSPDGDRIGSNEGTPKDNDGGGLGNWHDMNYCCQKYGSPASGKSCNGSTFRTTSEAQAGWSSCWAQGQAGAFGTDAFAPWSSACADANCDASNWANGNNIDYDYAIMLR